MKKFLATFLALIFLMSLGISAFAAETQTKEEEALLSFLNELKEKYELQDSDLDTLLNLVGNVILKDKYEEKAIPVLRESLDSTETATVRFYQDMPNVPYMSVTDFYNQFYLLKSGLTEGMSFTRDGGVYTLTNFCGDKAVFDADADTIVIDNMLRFIKPAHDLQTQDSDGFDPEYPYARTSHTIVPEMPVPKTIDLANYHIDLRGDETGVYAPLPTLDDIFASANGYFPVYSGEKIYMRDFVGDYMEKSAMDEDPDYLPAVKKDHPQDLAEFTYNELCLNIDLWYGKPGQEFIHEDLENGTFDEVLTAKYPEIKEMLRSTDFYTFFEGLNHVYSGLLSDSGHTAVACWTLIFDAWDLANEITRVVKTKDYGANYVYMSVKQDHTAQRLDARRELYNEDYYAEKGDTAIIKLDKFEIDRPAWKAFYTGKGVRPLKMNEINDVTNEPLFDTVGVVLSGLERAAKNPEIKNIIIDVSCNGGGNDTTLLAAEWLLTGVSYINDKDALTQQINTKHQLFDMNFDGVFDENDVSPYTGYNIGILTSDGSFSCGNAFPWFMHEHGAMILGEKSGGGACAIRLSSSAGLEVQASSAANCTVNDEGGTVDNGCPIDADLMTEGENPYVGFYDLDTLSKLMNEYFSESLEQAA